MVRLSGANARKHYHHEKPTIKHKANIIFQGLHNTKTKQKILLNSIALK